MGDTVLCEIDKGIAWVTLNNPKARNALSAQMRIDLRDVIGDLEHDDAVRCVVLRGAGDHFMAGGDIRAMKERLDIDKETRKRVVIEGIHAIHLPVFAIRRMRKPVIASVRGAAAGFGLGLVAACDLAIAADDAFFTLAYCHIGASPDGGSSYFLARTLGMKQAMELALLGDRFGADRALELGILNRVVPAADLEAETRALAERLAAGPTVAYAQAKSLFNTAFHTPMEQQLQWEGEHMAVSMTTEDHAEGVTAFLEKRRPVFKGA